MKALLGAMIAAHMAQPCAAVESAPGAISRTERSTCLAAGKHPRPAKQRAAKTEDAAEAKDAAKSRWQLAPKIIGGEETIADAWPFMAGLLFADQSDNFAAHFCGGTLVHPYWVVTAAHCVFGMDPSEVDVLLGEHDLTNHTAGRRIHVAEIIVHPDYKLSTMHADIALLRLAEPVEDYQPIEIVDAEELLQAGVMATAIGWGDTSGSGDYSPRLQQVDLPIAAPDVLTAYLGEHPMLTPSMLVAGWGVMGRDTGSGDSGGPLVVWDAARGDWMLAGITSFGFTEIEVPSASTPMLQLSVGT